MAGNLNMQSKPKMHQQYALTLKKLDAQKDVPDYL